MDWMVILSRLSTTNTFQVIDVLGTYCCNEKSSQTKIQLSIRTVSVLSIEYYILYFLTRSFPMWTLSGCRHKERWNEYWLWCAIHLWWSERWGVYLDGAKRWEPRVEADGTQTKCVSLECIALFTRFNNPSLEIVFTLLWPKSREQRAKYHKMTLFTEKGLKSSSWASSK